MAVPPITDIEPREDTGSHRRPGAPTAVPAPDPDPPGGARRFLADRAQLLVWGFMAVYAAVFSWMSVQGYRGFSTGRFDLGNMVQAVWSTTQGRPLDTTDISGAQFNRLGAHVDPVLVLFAPLWMVWSSPEMLLVAQAVIVSAGALPAFWLGRRWLGDDRLALAGAAAYLLYPALGNATLFDFHPVTLAAPLLLFCIWAVEEARWVTLGICATLAALCQEQVGLLLVALGIWAWFRHPEHRRAAVALAVSSLAWVAIAVGVIMPAFALQATNAHLDRYSQLGSGPSDIALNLVTRPWEFAEVLLTPGRLLYLVGLLVPLLLLPLCAPVLAAVAVPQLLINLFASTGPAQNVDYHYAVLITPVFVAAALLGLANLRARGLEGRLGRLVRPVGRDGRAARRRRDPHRRVAGAAAAVGLGTRGVGECAPERTRGGHARPGSAASGGRDPARRRGVGHQRRRIAPVGPRADPPLPEAPRRGLGGDLRRDAPPPDGPRPPDPAPLRHPLAGPATPHQQGLAPGVPGGRGQGLPQGCEHRPELSPRAEGQPEPFCCSYACCAFSTAATRCCPVASARARATALDDSMPVSDSWKRGITCRASSS